jgi:putative tricarboxylic transport membrane protein
MRKADIISAVVLLALAVGVAVGTLELPYWAEVAPGPAFAARWVAAIAAVLAAVLLWEAWSRGTDSAIEWPERDGVRRVLAACVLLWAFCLALPYAGFVTAGAAFMMAMLVGVQGRALAPSALATVVTVAGGYAIFIRWLQIKLPLGPWGI